MFHNKDNSTIGEIRKIIQQGFQYAFESGDKQICDQLDKTGVKVAWLYLFGYKMSKFELQEYFQGLNKNYYTDGLDYKQFEEKAMNEIKRIDVVEEMRNAFITLDFSCRGFLTLEDLRKQFKHVLPTLSDVIVKETFDELDTDCDGRISYRDFEMAMQYDNCENNSSFG